jgi:hypothetical protein
MTRDVVFNESEKWDWSGEDKAKRSMVNHSDAPLTMEYREVFVPKMGEEDRVLDSDVLDGSPMVSGAGGHNHNPLFDSREEEDSDVVVSSSRTSGTAMQHQNPLFEPMGGENLDADCDDVPLWCCFVRELIGLVEPTGRLERELTNNDGDRVYTMSAEEPTLVT